MSLSSQSLLLTSNGWKISLSHIEGWEHDLTLQIQQEDAVIQLGDNRKPLQAILIEDLNSKEKRRCFLLLDQGSIVLEPQRKSNARNADITGNQLIISVGICFVSIDLNSFTLNWKYEDYWPVYFEFHPLEDDYLLRGEMDVVRISKRGEVRWKYSGKDIWVNLDGKPEIKINDSSISLTDFNGETYEIDFDGKLIDG